jgi:hypothetical protein
MTAPAAAVLAAAITTASCAAPLMSLPTGRGVPAADAAAVLGEALKTCRSIKTITAEVAVSGSIEGRRMRGRLAVGLAAPASAYVEAPAPFGSPHFVLAAEDDNATLLLPRERRVLENGPASAVLEAIAGVPLGPAVLRRALTGCAEDAARTTGEQLGDRWRRIPGSEELYVYRERPADPWRLVAVVHRDASQLQWRAEYRDFAGDLPRSVRLTSIPPRRFDLRLSLSQVEVDGPIDANTFKVNIPPGTAPMTLEELRDAGPLANR